MSAGDDAFRVAPTKGDRFVWAPDGDAEIVMTVRRVARDLAWADIHCVDPFGTEWTKRQPLPFPADCQLVRPRRRHD